LSSTYGRRGLNGSKVSVKNVKSHFAFT
jgi:hypothetical protein